MSDAISTLAELVAPLTEVEFLSILRERKLTYLPTESRGRYSTLLSWETLLGMIERGDHPRGLADFRLAKESVTVPPDRWLVRSKTENKNKIDTSKVDEFLAAGFSLIITPIQAHVPPLAALCEDIASRVSERIKVGVIVTIGSGGAFKLHYDPEDLIILQLEGTKRWRMYGPRVLDPVIGMPAPPSPPETSPIFDEVLQPGDFLFLPAGTWHHCENGPGRSLHLGIFFIPPTGWHAVNAITSQLLSEDVLRRPLTRLKDASELAALEAEFKVRLVERLSHLNLSEFLVEWNKRKPGS